jgi:hypothetical protein
VIRSGGICVSIVDDKLGLDGPQFLLGYRWIVGWATSLIFAMHGNGKNAAKRSNPPRPTGFLMAAAEPNKTKRALPATKLKGSSTSTE